MVCMVLLEGRGNSDWRKVWDLGSHFWRDRANAFSPKLHLLLSGLCLLFPTTVAKNLEAQRR